MKTKYISGNQAASITRKPSSPLRKDQQLELPSTQGEAGPSNGSVFDQILGETPTAPVHEPLLKKRQLAKHYGVCDRTIERWVTADMPRHYVGKRQMRFRLSEVQVWLQQNHIHRFAAHGIAMTVAEVKRRIINIPILNGLELVPHPVDAKRTGRTVLPLPRGEGRGEGQTGTSATPRCKPGRKPTRSPDVSCADNGHQWRTSRYTRTCAMCGRTEERDPCNRWREST